MANDANNANHKTHGKLSEQDVLRELAVEEKTQSARKRGWANIFWGLLGLLLVAALVAQYYWFTQRDAVLQHAQLRPALEIVCEYAGCALPITRDVQQLKISKNFMDKHDAESDAVLLHFIFANQAHFPQPYPGLEIRFEDENKKLIGIRRLAPQEYVNAHVDVLNLPPNTPVHVSLELQNTVAEMHTFGYSIDFL